MFSNEKEIEAYCKSSFISIKDYKKIHFNYYKLHREEILKRHREWKKNNKSKMKIYRQKYAQTLNSNLKIRRKRDVLFRLKMSLNTNIYNSFKNNGFSLNRKTHLNLNYSMFELKKHLESQFDSNMSWENYGSYWSIDHKMPTSFATTEKELWELYFLDNLQPLEHRTNISKGNRVVADLFNLQGVFE